MSPILIGVTTSILAFALIARTLRPRGARAQGRGRNRPFTPSAIEQRRQLRCAKHSVRIFYQTGAEEQLQEGWIIDRSAEGLGLILVVPNSSEPAEAPKRQTVLEIKPTNAPLDCPWLRVEVRHLHLEAGYWHIGARILNDVAADVLQHLGHEAAPENKPGEVNPSERRAWTGEAQLFQRKAHNPTSFSACDNSGMPPVAARSDFGSPTMRAA